MNERRPMQYAALSLAASAFVAVTQILAGAQLDLPLYVALTLFAANIPFQVILFFMPAPLRLNDAVRRRVQPPRFQDMPRHEKIYVAIYWLLSYLSMPGIVIGFAAMFWHFALWLGVLFAVTALGAYKLYRYCALEDYKQQSADIA